MKVEESYIIKNLKRFNDESLPNSFVALAAKVNELKQFGHAAILIRLKGRNFLYHYPSFTLPVVEDDFDEHGWYFYKIFSQIRVDDVNEVEGFLDLCRWICGKSNIMYAFFADKSNYNSKGEYISKNGLPELGTCVSFCVNTLSGFMPEVDSYLELDDWNSSSLGNMASYDLLLQEYARGKDIDMNIYNAFKKRVTPLEYVTSAFLEEYPIKREWISEIAPIVQGAV
ncbi:hypothetical protein [Hymenobacter properus]|uniref:Uncharacterized protein n=1 Tax=Hymenobacter properus TaxID=2791026 RepID=A0A931FLV2_9BACT|nr:hypothetical protein [Hymenobacter properus]MBF9141059.1 hypothetical protein [Hymenobacter properus]MBR7719868.1 hypothetical protein [Microvirga sp. SRT04]